MRKFRVAMGIVPLVYAMFANSPLADGGLNGYQSFRGHIWTDTDRARCGILEFAFSDERRIRGLRRVCARRADVLHHPRHNTSIEQPPGITFRQYMERGFGRSARPSRTGAMHLTTIFPRCA